MMNDGDNDFEQMAAAIATKGMERQIWERELQGVARQHKGIVVH